MHYNEESLMESFDKWKEDDRRERFFHRMEHKLAEQNNVSQYVAQCIDGGNRSICPAVTG